ncbi:hypothetical protein RB4457 [Rhodopirellula baltica SH 1]|uniref:Uncharacterized protein n=1 Tax=Rhodopirellula baltica (strain DSM 10527 / NCIMB 13988 / SH1) TaxID=243090 RepID=Q7USK0_RHOBA|nr:hypothetical protein RB4457 [Rhodopirellula baltica SH 1]
MAAMRLRKLSSRQDEERQTPDEKSHSLSGLQKQPFRSPAFGPVVRGSDGVCHHSSNAERQLLTCFATNDEQVSDRKGVIGFHPVFCAVTGWQPIRLLI